MVKLHVGHISTYGNSDLLLVAYVMDTQKNAFTIKFGLLHAECSLEIEFEITKCILKPISASVSLLLALCLPQTQMINTPITHNASVLFHQ